MECKICDKVSKILQALEKNEKESHIKCPRCERTFVSKWNCRWQVKKDHEGIKPFACGLCNSTYAHHEDIVHIHEPPNMRTGQEKKPRKASKRSYADEKHPALIRKAHELRKKHVKRCQECPRLTLE